MSTSPTDPTQTGAAHHSANDDQDSARRALAQLIADLIARQWLLDINRGECTDCEKDERSI